MTTAEENLVECRLCGKRWRSLGHHLRSGHSLSPNKYRDRFGIRRSEPLTSMATRARMSDLFRATINAGKLDGHFAGNAARAVAASAAGQAAKRDLREAGVDIAGGSPATPRDVLVAIVSAIEAGARVATAVKHSPIAYSTFHVGLARHPDLKERIEAARQNAQGRRKREASQS